MRTGRATIFITLAAVVAVTVVAVRLAGRDHDSSSLWAVKDGGGVSVVNLIQFNDLSDGTVEVRYAGGNLHVPAAYMRRRSPEHAYFEVEYVVPGGDPLRDPMPPPEDVVRLVFQYHENIDGVAEPRSMHPYSTAHEVFRQGLHDGRFARSRSVHAGLVEYTDGVMTYLIPLSLDNNGQVAQGAYIFFCFAGFGEQTRAGERRCRLNVQYLGGWTVQADYAEKQLVDWERLLHDINDAATSYGVTR